ncbi:MAG: FixH family protein [Arenimonas sp.]
MKIGSAIREPMVWLMFGIPILTAIAGLYTLHIAGLANATDVVNMPVTRMAQVQEVDLSADETAARKNLSAHLKIEKGQLEIFGIATTTDKFLTLDLQHPIDQSQDLHLVMQRQGNRFVSSALINKNNDWLLQLSDPSRQWRLVGRLHRQSNSADLKASVRLP